MLQKKPNPFDGCAGYDGRGGYHGRGGHGGDQVALERPTALNRLNSQSAEQLLGRLSSPRRSQPKGNILPSPKANGDTNKSSPFQGSDQRGPDPFTQTIRDRKASQVQMAEALAPYRSKSNFYSNREQRASAFFNQTINANTRYETTQFAKRPKQYQQEYKKEAELVKSAARHGVPTAASFTMPSKDSFYWGQEKILTERVPFYHQTRARRFSNQFAHGARQVLAKPAGYSNYGPQLAPHNVPAQPSLYYYKR